MSLFPHQSNLKGCGLSHAIGHRIGATYNIPHGITSCITLPHVIRFYSNSDNPFHISQLARVTRVISPQTTTGKDSEDAQKVGDIIQ